MNESVNKNGPHLAVDDGACGPTCGKEQVFVSPTDPNRPSSSEADSPTTFAPKSEPEEVGTTQAEEPSATDAAPPCPPDTVTDTTSIICKRCGQANEAGLDRCAGCHSVLKGNRLALKHGLHVTNNTPALQAFEDEGRALLRQSITDAGGATELSARELDLHRWRASISVDLRKLEAALSAHGLFDRRGRLRLAWLAKKESLAYTLLAFDKLLGLSRKTKNATLADWLVDRSPNIDQREAMPSNNVPGDQ